MWQLTTPWYELIMRSGSVFILLFLIMRFWGKKHFAQLSPFDFILLLIVSEALQNALIGNDLSVTGSFISVLTLFTLNVVLNRLAFSSKKLEQILEGSPTLIIHNGKIIRKAMLEQKLSHEQLMEALRQQGVDEITQVRLAIMETNGSISVIKNNSSKA